MKYRCTLELQKRDGAGSAIKHTMSLSEEKVTALRKSIREDSEFNSLLVEYEE